MKTGIYFGVIVALMGCTSHNSTEKKVKQTDTLAHVVVDTSNNDEFQTGDVIFQTTGGRLMVPLQEATGNDFTHCGVIIAEDDGSIMVAEAFDSVMKTPVEKWIDRGVGEKYAVLRMKKKESLGANEKNQMRLRVNELLGLPYDQQYMWGNDKLYCSELVYKAYLAAGIELCKLRPMRSYNLKSPQVKQAMKLIYQGKIPYNENMVAPGDIYTSALLTEVKIK